MAEITAGVSWIAVIVGAVVSFGLGALWYSPKMFGTKWLESIGIPSDDNSSVKAAMTTQLIGTLLLAWVIGVTAVNEALMTAILIVLTIVALMTAGSLFARKGTYAVVVEAGFVVAMAVIMIVCQAIF